MYKKLYIFLLICFCQQVITAQTVTPYKPTQAEMVKRYLREAWMDSATKNSVFKTTVAANWLPGGKSFWYVNRLKDSVQEYIFVDAAKAKKQPLFDRRRLAEQLGKMGISVDSLRPSLSSITMEKENKLLFKVNGEWVECDLSNYTCTKVTAPPAGASEGRRFGDRGPGTSPDKKWQAYVEKGNVFVKPAEGGTPIQFTTDGTEEKPYGGVRWSPDSKYLAGFHINTVKNDPVYYILSSVPGTTRGQLRSQPYKQPGEAWTVYTLFLFNIAQQKAIKANAEIVDFLNTPELRWRSDNPNLFLYEKMDRGHQRFRVIEVDAAANTSRFIVDEQTKTFIYNTRCYRNYLPATNQLVRTSEKDGWQHVYLVDLVTGKEQPITKGNWVVRGVDSVDAVKKEIWFRASGMNAGEDPYNIHYYRIGFDGNNMKMLTPAKGNHTVVFSADKNYFTDTYSQVNIAPRTVLSNINL